MPRDLALMRYQSTEPVRVACRTKLIHLLGGVISPAGGVPPCLAGGWGSEHGREFGGGSLEPMHDSGWLRYLAAITGKGARQPITST